MQTILRLPAVKARTGWGTSHLYGLIRKGEFPAPIKIGKRASGWIEAEVEAYLERRIAEARSTNPTHQNVRDARSGRWAPDANPVTKPPRKAQERRSSAGEGSTP